MTRRRAALSGLLASSAALTAGELAGRLVPGAVSPVLAVGQHVIATTPSGVREAIIGQTGTADKPALITGIVVIVLTLGAIIGLLCRRFRRAGFAAVLTLGLVAAAATLGATTASGPINLGVELLAASLGLLVLRMLLPAPGVPANRSDDRVGRHTRPTPAGLSRRAFLVRSATVAAASAAGVFLVRGASNAADVARLRSRIRLPQPGRAAPAVPADASFPGNIHSPLVTSNAAFYKVDTALATPQIGPRTWTLTLGGLLEHPASFTYDDLLAMPQTEAWITVGCVGNPVGGPLVGTARWQGVLLADLLRAAGPKPGAAQVVGRSTDGYTGAFPLPFALDGRTALVALGMNGEPLPVGHGFPARLVVPGLYGYESAVKWLDRIDLVDEGFNAFWVTRGYAKSAVFRTTSRIDTPHADSALTAGTVTVAGMAWAPHRGISRVEVSIDAGPWQAAQLTAATLGPDTWRPWRHTWQASPGTHVIAVRATDGTGQLQRPAARGVLPDGATGDHQIAITVTP